MDYKDPWNYLCEQHHSGWSKEEAQIQSDWENYFAESELFGYSRIKNDIISQPRLVLGSTEREIPDILLCRNGEKLFVAELKRYSLPKNEKFEKQLLNYLTHTDIHLSVGILICEKIYIYCYDFSANKHLSLEIPFEKDNSDGIRFVELFSKQNFDEKKIQDFVVSRNQASQNISKIKESINESLVKNLLKEHFLKNFSEDDFEKAIHDISIIISRQSKENNLHEIPQGKYAEIDSQKLTKQQIYSLCKQYDIEIDTSNLTLAGRKENDYPANPKFNLLDKDWWIALDDRELKKLHIFLVPASSIPKEKMIPRKDKTHRFLFYVCWSSPSFLERKSGIKFKQWLVKTISY